jgi:hypothetical protein
MKPYNKWSCGIVDLGKVPNCSTRDVRLLISIDWTVLPILVVIIIWSAKILHLAKVREYLLHPIYDSDKNGNKYM